MSKNHLKRNAASKRWILLRKKNKYVLKPRPGRHILTESIPLAYFLKDQGFANTLRETKKLVQLNDVLIDKKKIKDVKCSISFMDVITVGENTYRCLFDEKGRITFLKINNNEADRKICKILNKNKTKGGKIQLNLNDGRNILVEKDDFKKNDSILIELPTQKILKHFSFKEGSTIVLTDGKYVGKTGKIQKVLNERIFFKEDDGQDSSTLKEYAFVTGNEKSEIQIK